MPQRLRVNFGRFGFRMDDVVDNPLQLTDWMDAGVRPTRGGVYERRSPAGRYACWDGQHWYADAATPVQASRRHGLSSHQAVPWRGVAEPTSARCATCRGHSVLDRGFDEDAARDLIDECPDC